MVQVGIIGIGRIGKIHLQNIASQVSGAHVKTVADPCMTDDAAALAKSFGVNTLSKDYHDILQDPEIDAVFICSFTDTHAAISVEAIEAGKHVFCEKPIDHDVAKIKKVIAALESSSRQIYGRF